MVMILLVLAVSLLSPGTRGSLAYVGAQQQGNCSQCRAPNNGKAFCSSSGMCRAQCDDGFVLVNGACDQGCPPGKQLDNAGRCTLCPRNTYKSSSGVGRCKRCPLGRVTVGLRPSSRDAETDCLAGGLLYTGNSVKGMELATILAAFEESLNVVRSFIGKGGGRRNGCMINCDAEDTAAGAAEAVLAGSPLAYRSDEPWMGLPGRLPRAKDQAPCATVVGIAMSSVLEASLASLKGQPIAAVPSLSPTHAYFCSPPDARKCTTGWTNDGAALAVARQPAAFFADANCTGTGKINATTCNSVAKKCGPGPVTDCTVEALDAFYTIQRAIRRNGAVISSMLLDDSFKAFLTSSPNGTFNATMNQKAKEVIRISVTLVGYDNRNHHWWVLLPFGPSFGLVRVGYGAAGVGNPEETYALNCRLTEGSESLVKPRYLRPDFNQSGCYWYTVQPGEFCADIADVLHLDILQLVSDNAARGLFSFNDAESKQPYLQQSLAGKDLHVCGVRPDLFKSAVALDCPAGLVDQGVECAVCPDDTYKSSNRNSCVHCPAGKVTVGMTAADHDEESDCKPAEDYLLCDRYIGKAKSGVYPVTISGKQYQVYCDLETDGGGWMLVMNYNKKEGTAPPSYTRALEDGFPLLNHTGLGFDESKSIGVGGSWGAMGFDVLGALPKLTEFRLFLQNGDGTIHLKSAERNSFQYIQTGRNNPQASGYTLDRYTLPQYGLQLLQMQPEYTPLPGHTQWAALTELVKAASRNAILAFEKNSLWVDGLMSGARFNTHAQLWLRGSAGSAPNCPPGSFAVGWGCHICPEGSYKANAGPEACSKCPSGMVTGAGSAMRGRDITAHDSLQDCQPAIPVATLDKPGGGYVDIYKDPLLTAPEAEAACIRNGGHLVSVPGPEDEKFLLALSDPPYLLGTYWTGGVYVLANKDAWHQGYEYSWTSRAMNAPNFLLDIRFTELSTMWGAGADNAVIAWIVHTVGIYTRGEGRWAAVLPGALLPFLCERWA